MYLLVVYVVFLPYVVNRFLRTLALNSGRAMNCPVADVLLACTWIKQDTTAALVFAYAAGHAAPVTSYLVTV